MNILDLLTTPKSYSEAISGGANEYMLNAYLKQGKLHKKIEKGVVKYVAAVKLTDEPLVDRQKKRQPQRLTGVMKACKHCGLTKDLRYFPTNDRARCYKCKYKQTTRYREAVLARRLR